VCLVYEICQAPGAGCIGFSGAWRHEFFCFALSAWVWQQQPCMWLSLCTWAMLLLFSCFRPCAPPPLTRAAAGAMLLSWLLFANCAIVLAALWWPPRLVGLRYCFAWFGNGVGHEPWRSVRFGGRPRRRATRLRCLSVWLHGALLTWRQMGADPRAAEDSAARPR
jgi:hypothetical protein